MKYASSERWHHPVVWRLMTILPVILVIGAVMTCQFMGPTKRVTRA